MVGGVSEVVVGATEVDIAEALDAVGLAEAVSEFVVSGCGQFEQTDCFVVPSELREGLREEIVAARVSRRRRGARRCCASVDCGSD